MEKPRNKARITVLLSLIFLAAALLGLACIDVQMLLLSESGNSDREHLSR